MKQDILHKKIELYFDGDLSVEEERQLLSELLTAPSCDPLMEEALAVMGYARFTAGDSRSNSQRRTGGHVKTLAHVKRITVGIVAAAVVAVALIGFIRTEVRNEPLDRGSVCLAYMGGDRIDSRQKVIELINEQLEEMNAASQTMDGEVVNDLNEIREALNLE